jgi:hypothetical protein
MPLTIPPAHLTFLIATCPTIHLQSCLAASNWDLSAAMEALRLKGLAAAVKKASRHASEGLVAVSQVRWALLYHTQCAAKLFIVQSLAQHRR